MEELDENNPTVRRLLEQVQRLENRLAAAEAKLTDMDSPFGRLVLIKRGVDPQADGTTSGKQWREQCVVGGTVIDFEDGRRCDDDDNPAALIAPGVAQFAVEFEDNDATRYVPLQTLFPVSLVKSSGIDGTQSSPATYKYDVYVESVNTKIGHDIDLAYTPRPNGKMTEASAGWAAYTGDTLNLYITNERPGTGAC